MTFPFKSGISSVLNFLEPPKRNMAPPMKLLMDVKSRVVFGQVARCMLFAGIMVAGGLRRE